MLARAGAGFQGFHPSQLSGLVAHWDLSDTQYIQKDGSDLVAQVCPVGSGLENLVLRSGDLGNAAWTKTRSSYSGGVLTEDATAGSSHYIIPSGVAIVNNVAYRIRARVKLKERHCSIRFDASAGFSAGYAHFNLSTGAIFGVTGSVINPTITADTDGYYIISAEHIATAAGTAYPSIYLASVPGTVGYNGDNASGAYVDWVQFHRTLSKREYTATVASAVTANILTASDTARPTWTASAINSRPAARFDGSSDVMRADSAAASMGGTDAPISIVAVISPSVVTAVNRCACSLGAASGTPLFLMRATSAGGGGEFTVLKRDDASASATATGTVPTAAPQIISAVHSGTTTSLYRNGSLVGAADQAMNVGATTFSRFAIGARDDGAGLSDLITGDIGEVLLFSKALSTSELTSVTNFLKARWGIA